MKVLVACEYSGTVRDAFIRRGHDAVSCDLLPTESDFGPHYQGNVLDILDDGWDMMIAHPPCTYLANSGVRWLYKRDEQGVRKYDQGRFHKMWDACCFFEILYDAPIDRVCIENPIMHGFAKDIIDAQQSQTVQPWMFGHMETKATCLWLRGLPALVPTDDVKEQMLQLDKKEYQRVHNLAPSKDRWKQRSTTYLGIAEAMAQQWG